MEMWLLISCTFELYVPIGKSFDIFITICRDKIVLDQKRFSYDGPLNHGRVYEPLMKIVPKIYTFSQQKKWLEQIRFNYDETFVGLGPVS